MLKTNCNILQYFWLQVFKFASKQLAQLPLQVYAARPILSLCSQALSIVWVIRMWATIAGRPPQLTTGGEDERHSARPPRRYDIVVVVVVVRPRPRGGRGPRGILLMTITINITTIITTTIVLFYGSKFFMN